MQKQRNRTLLAGTKHNYCLIRRAGFYMIQVFTETHWNVFNYENEIQLLI